jgi:protein tyrosine phosphatase
MGRTGAFICIHAMLDRVNSEHIIDFFQFVKSSRINRPDIIREEEHYVMCHEAVAEYLDSFQTYANFT